MLALVYVLYFIFFQLIVIIVINQLLSILLFILFDFKTLGSEIARFELFCPVCKLQISTYFRRV